MVACTNATDEFATHSLVWYSCNIEVSLYIACKGGSEIRMRGNSGHQHDHECNGNRSQDLTSRALCRGVG